MSFLHKQNRFVVCQYGDSHGGNTLGLMNPEVELVDAQGHRYNPTLTEPQEYLHELFIEHSDKAMEFADGDDLYVLHLGDITQGNKHFPEKISTKIADQIHVGRANFWYWKKYKNLKAIRLVVGTPAHNFGEQTAEELTIELLKADMPKVDMKVLYHGLLDINGVLFDYAHRGPQAGKRNWLKGNEEYGMGTYEDVEYCLRLRDMGYNILIEQEAIGEHFVGATAMDKQIQYPLQRNQALLLERMGNKLLYTEWEIW